VAPEIARPDAEKSEDLVIDLRTPRADPLTDPLTDPRADLVAKREANGSTPVEEGLETPESDFGLSKGRHAR
jgi:hypothetical protein